MGANPVLLGLGDDATGILGLEGVEAGQVVAGFQSALDVDGLGGQGPGRRGAEGHVEENSGHLHLAGC